MSSFSSPSRLLCRKKWSAYALGVMHFWLSLLRRPFSLLHLRLQEEGAGGKNKRMPDSVSHAASFYKAAAGWQNQFS